MRRVDVWIVLVSWNSHEDVLRCLRALQLQTYPALHIIVVDNGSSDGTASTARRLFPQTRVIALPRNHGFAFAVNIGLRYALEHNAGYVLLLNPDTVLDRLLIERLVAFTDSNHRVGMVSPKIYLADRPDRLWGIGGVVKSSGLSFCDVTARDTGQHDTRRLDFILGCALLIRAEVLQQIGLLDERFFVFYEEIDLCLRAKAAGWQVAIVPEAQILHVGGASTSDCPHWRAFHLARSRMLFLRKHSARFKLRHLLFSETLAAIGSVLRDIYRLRLHSAFASIQGMLTGLLAHPAIPKRSQ
jgi:GT2 family glycosyltransferase